MYICVSVKIKKGFDIQYLLSIIGASLSSPTLTMSTAPLSVCVCAAYVRTSCRIVLFAHSQWVPLANLCRLSGAEGFQVRRMRTKQG